MNKFRSLLKNISEEYSINLARNENEDQLKCRIIYSVLGQMARASLYDQTEDEEIESVSIIHFKRRIVNTLNSYRELYPEIKRIFDAEEENVTNEIYQLYLACGQMYHKPNQVVPCQRMVYNCEPVSFLRGKPFDKGICISGLGMYKFCNSPGSISELLETFHINGNTLLSLYDYLISTSKWEKSEIQQENAEYLILRPPFSRGYWKQTPDKNEEVSLLRINSIGEHIYYLYKFDNDDMYVSSVPLWMTEKPDWMQYSKNYRMISNAILANKMTLPSIETEELGSYVKIKFNYLPARDIHDFIKFYSWPTTYHDVTSDFIRYMATEVWMIFRQILEYLGYVVEEL